MTLSVIIPVHNDPDGLTRLLTQLAEMQIADQILVCDDASTPPCRPLDLGFDEDALGIRYLRNAKQRGAGFARNLGIKALTTDHVLFCDSDDLLTPEITDLLRDLDGQDFDFCLFRHIDSRERARGRPGPMAADQALWDQIGLRQEAPQLLSPAQIARIVMIAAYPWNKIYRSAFLHEHSIRCSEIPVHNDIELHWASFMQARRVLASPRLCCEHFVQTGHNRLTNRRDSARLQVFEALAPLHQRLHQNRQAPQFLLPMVRFYTRLFGWIEDTLEPEHHAALHQKISAFLLEQHSEATVTFIAGRDPGLAHHLNDLIRRGWA